jgi:NAD(P)-dependent dehydrogenase (short-subunit alcohol dehydrogenase family)
VNISSVHGYAGFVGHTVYAGTKGAINAFTRSLAVEVCPEHIRVNAVGPGVVEVPGYWKRFVGYTHEMGNSWVPWGRAGMPEDVARLVAFLVSDASEFITGQNIYFDGGTTAKMSIPEHY